MLVFQASPQRWGQMDAVTRGRGALPLLLFILFVSLKGSACVEHPAEEPLLPLYCLPFQPAPFQTARELRGLVRHLTRAGDIPFSAHLLQFLRQRALASGESLQLLPDGPAARHRQHARTLLSQATLLLSQLRQPLE